MNRKRITILLLLAVHALAVIGVLSLFRVSFEIRWLPTAPTGLLTRIIADIPEMIVISLPLSQGSLLAVWAAMSGRRRPWRFLLVIIGVVVAVKTLARVITWDLTWDLDEFAGILLIQFFAAAPFFFLMRFVGFELVSAPAPSDADDADNLRWMQFSLRSLMAWTTGLAALLGMASMMPNELRILRIEEWLHMLFLKGLAGLLSMVTVRTALGSERSWLTFTVFALTLAIVGQSWTWLRTLAGPATCS